MSAGSAGWWQNDWMMSLRNRLTFWFTCLLTIVGVGGGIVAYVMARQDPDSFLDDQLRQIAIYAGDVPAASSDAVSTPIDASDIVVVQVWDGGNRMIRATPEGFDLPRQAATGFSDLTLREERWRTYTLAGKDRTVQVSQRAAVREELALNAAWTAMLPSLLLIPVGWLVVRWLVGRMLRPIDRIAEDLNRRGPMQFTPPPLGEIPVEVIPLVRAMSEALARLREAIAFQRRFISDAAHHFRTPLTALRLQIGSLKTNAAADHREVIADMELGVRRMSTLTNQLLVLARSESLQQAASSETAIPVAAALREVIAAILPLAQEKGVELAMRSDSDPHVCADRDALVTLLSNIADNAVRYSGPGARVELSIYGIGDRVVIEIADNGPGLPEEMLTEVFTRFFRHNDTEEGSGLGLSIARALADRLQGSISLQNRKDRSGLIATISLPLAGAM
jgi:two-component system OmpR family sensor kinase